MPALSTFSISHIHRIFPKPRDHSYAEIMTSWPVNQTIPSLSAPWMFSSSANNNQIGSSPSAPWTFSSSANEEQGAKTFNALRSQASHVQHRWSSDQMDEMEMCTIERIDDCISTPLIQESPNMITQKPFPFLSLPGEIRNNIYRYALVSPKPYTVKLQFPPSDTGLLRANKQIYSEASTIFYHENTFRFPQTLFEGGAILERLWRVYHLPPWKLQRMRNFAIDIPVRLHFDWRYFSTSWDPFCCPQLPSTSVIVPSTNISDLWPSRWGFAAHAGGKKPRRASLISAEANRPWSQAGSRFHHGMGRV